MDKALTLGRVGKGVGGVLDEPVDRLGLAAHVAELTALVTRAHERR
jgi:hypothetical protein